MSDTYLTADFKDTALVIECQNCGSAFVVTAGTDARSLDDACLACRALLFEYPKLAEFFIGAYRDLSSATATTKGARLRIRVSA
jgi:hypothetical protein